MGSKAFESPLISHVRMRALFRALVEVRGLAKSAKLRGFRGVEACWVGTAIDLREGDLTSAPGLSEEDAMLAHVRAVGVRPLAAGLSVVERRRVLASLEASLRGGPAGVFAGTAQERLLCAVGAGMALKAAAAGGVVLAYAGRGELKTAEWRRVFKLMGAQALPVIVVVLPSASAKGELEAEAGKASLPLIPVDAGDAVAIYRVAQETMVRARAGGGAAVIEGIDCGTDAVALLGSQLVRKQICTARWVEDVRAKFSKQVR